MSRPASPDDSSASSAPDAAPDADAAAASSPDHGESSSESSSSANRVAAGIFSSRIVGLLRERTIAYFFGVSAHADALQIAFKLPNLLQNLLGEGTISAAFIPIYSRMVEDGRPREAGRFAGAIFGLLLAVVSILSLAGIFLAEPLVTVLAPGFLDDAAGVAAGRLSVDRFALTVQAIRIIFPMAGILVLSAWALGVLNSHRRFFVPYVAPVLWNVAIIASLFAAAYWATGSPWAPTTLGTDVLTRLLMVACVGALLGGVLQFGVQLPFVAQQIQGFRPSISLSVPGVREALRAFGPVVAGRGVAQVSGYLDTVLAGLLHVGALSSIRFSLILYLLPISLFGMSVAASELPELSRLTDEKVRAFTGRLRRSLRQIAFLTVPSVVGYLAFGYLIVGALLRTGQFQAGGNWLVYLVLCGYSLGILATTYSRLLQNAFYALDDTTTPARIAVVRVVVSTIVAVPVMFSLDQIPLPNLVNALMGDGTLPSTGGDEPLLYLGAIGLSVGASVGAWVELALLKRALRDPMPKASLPLGALARMIALAIATTLPAAGVWWLLPDAPPLIVAPVVGGTYAAAYLGLAALFGFDELQAWKGRFGRS